MAITIDGTNGISGVDGTVSNPALEGTDSNTGVYFPAADTVSITTNGAERFRIGSAGQLGVGGASYGTTGQVFTSNGASSAPSWNTLSATGQLIRAPQLLTSGTSYTTPAGCNNIFIEMIGAGGGGGGSNNVNTGSTGGGGGAAPYASVFVSVTPSTTYTYAIGSGGSGGSQANGTSGGTTSITIGATTYSISGGGGGTYVNNGNGSAGSSGAATNFSFTLTSFLQAATVPGGGSCATPYGLNVGGNVISPPSNAGSVTGYGWGAGGGGGISGSAGARAGGAGYQGMIRIWEYT